jgi:hypothetical protein
VFVICAIGMCMCATATADAKTKPTLPTAKQLVQKLVKAKICTKALAVDARGTMYQCPDDPGHPGTGIVIHAYTTQKAMLASLDAGRIKACADFQSAFGVYASPSYRPQFRVGKWWWTFAYPPALSAAIQNAIGGKLQEFACT